MTKVCDFCHEIIENKKDIIEVKSTERNPMSKTRPNGTWTVFFLHKHCHVDTFRPLFEPALTPEKRERIISAYEAKLAKKAKNE